MSLGDVENNIDIIVRMLGAATAAAEAVKVAASIDTIDGAAAKAAATTTALSASFDKMSASGKKMQTMGGTMTRHLTIPIIAIGAAATKMSLDYDQAMQLIVTQAHAPQAELDAVRDKTMQIGAAFGQMPVHAAQAMYHIESTGIRGAKALDILRVASMGAAVGQADLDSTSYALSSTVASGIGGVNNATEAMGVLNAVVGAGDMHMQDLNGAISTGILPTAKTFGITLQQVGASLAAMTDAGTPATEAATRLRMSISLLGAPSMAASKQLETIGLSSLDLGKKMREDGPIGALELLRKKLNDFSKDPTVQANILSRAFGGGRSSSTIMGLLGNLDTLDYGLKDKQTAVDGGTGKLEGDWAKQSKTDAQRLKIAGAEFEDSMVKMGQALRPTIIPLIETLADDIGGVADAFSHLSPGQQKIITDFALLAVVMGPGVKLSGMLLSTYGTMGKVLARLIPMQAAATEEQVAMDAAMTANPVGLLVMSLAALGFAFYEIQKHPREFKHAVDAAFHGIGHAIKWARGEVVGFGHDVKHVVDATLAPLHKLGSIAGSLSMGIPGASGGGTGDALKAMTKHIPGLATGGTYNSAGLSLVGENGPEVRYEPKPGASIIPLPALRGAQSQAQMDPDVIRQAILDGFERVPPAQPVVQIGRRVVAEAASDYTSDRRARR